MTRADYGAGSMIERTPGHWRLTVDLGRDPRTGKRLRHRVTFVGSKREAAAALRAAMSKRDNGVLGPVEKVTVATWLDSWLERHVAEGHIQGRAHERYAGIINKHLTPALGSLPLQKLRVDHVADLKAAWLSGDAESVSKPLSGASVHKHLVVLRQALDEAVKAGVIVRNPVDAVSAPSVKPQAERRTLEQDEIRAVLTAATSSRFDVPIRLALATGMRESELLGLPWSDVDLDNGTLEVRRVLSYVEGNVVFKEPKSDRSRRTIELSPATVAILREHRVRQAERRLKLGPIWRENGLVFPSRVGGPWLPRDFYRDYRAVVVASGVSGPETVVFHTWRHTAATQWIKAGVDVFVVSRRLGHSSAAFTMDRYAHLLSGQQSAAASALDYLLG